jgi:hypothetical protein
VVHRIREEAAGFSEEGSAPASGFRVLRKAALPQCAEEHLLGNLSLAVARHVQLPCLAQLDAEGLGAAIFIDDRPDRAAPAGSSFAGRDTDIPSRDAITKCLIEERAQRALIPANSRRDDGMAERGGSDPYQVA